MTRDKYKNVIMNSYQTRIRDGAEAPRDASEFQRSITRIMQGQINNEAKNFFLEQMLRILPSKNKLFKMKRLETLHAETSNHDAANICIQCNVLSLSSHQAAYCIYPTYAIYALNNLSVWKEKLPSLTLNPLILEFHTEIYSLQDTSLKRQTDLIMLNIKKQGFELWRDPLFYRMSSRRLHIHLLRSLKSLLELTKGTSKSRRSYWWIETILEGLIQEENTLTEFYRTRFDPL